MTTIAPVDPVTPGSARLTELIAEIGATSLEREQAQERPFAQIALLRDAGLGAIRIPRELGGGGATLRELFQTVVRLASADVHVAHILRGHFAFVEERLRLPVEDRARALDVALRRELVGNAATEIGTTAVGQFTYRTKLTADGHRFRLDGTKYFTTGTLFADHADVIASLPDGRTAFVIVPTRREGVTILDDWDGFGQRLTGTGTARFANVAVEADEFVIPEPGPGGQIGPFYHSGAFFQLYVSAAIVGVLHAIREDAIAHIHQRTRSFEWAPAPVAAEDPLLQREVGELASYAFAAEATLLAAVDELAVAYAAAVAGEDPDFLLAEQASFRAAQAKVVIDELGQRGASQLFNVGGASIVREVHGLDRHWRNIRTLASHNPTPYKAQAVGAKLLVGTSLPGNGYF
jgi:alkylation response protein AidB-like acyl-CoA dehydrogenase